MARAISQSRIPLLEKEFIMEKNQNEMWAIIELMGHGQTAGIIRTSDLGGLLRVDVPMGNEGFRTEYYGEQAIYAIRCVSEEIARAYAIPEREILAYNEPIVPRAQYEEALQKARNHNDSLQHQIAALQRRLIQVNSLPEAREEEIPV
jgi:hypothetical protein